MKIFKRILSKLRGIFSLSADNPSQKNSHSNNIVSNQLPDVTEMEKTMFLLGKVHSVFDFSPPIPLVPEIRILNKALSYHYNVKNTSLEEAEKTTEKVIETVHRFSYILPEIDLLLNKIESSSQDFDKQILKNEIITSLEKVTNEKKEINKPSVKTPKNKRKDI